MIENQKERAENFDDENDMIDAFVACGGRPDKAGHVKRETLGAPPHLAVRSHETNRPGRSGVLFPPLHLPASPPPRLPRLSFRRYLPLPRRVHLAVKIIKHDFGLTIDIEDLINKIDTDGSGEIEFEEFKTLLS